MITPESILPPTARGNAVSSWTWPALFSLVLLVHFFLATRGWQIGALRGHEFRQTQTAISAFYIQAENNFSLAYPTPVLGKPWSIPMEFPLYQWSVVWLSNNLNLSLVTAGRTVALICFYLMLPGLYILLGRLELPPQARWLSLIMVVVCPLYIFYSRAFMIESMALMMSVWFLASFVAAMRTRHFGWLILCAMSGAGAALVKVTTLMIWMTPAAGYGLFLLYRSHARGWRQFWQTGVWGLAVAAGPCLAAVWWVQASDAIKSLNPAGRFLMSGPMRSINFSTWSERFHWDVWAGMIHNWNTALMPVWLMAIGMPVIVGQPSRWRRLGILLVAVFLAAQFTFPRLFTWHDYYFYAIGLFWLGAAGIALHAVIDSRLPRGLAAGLIAVVLAIQLNTYRVSYYATQTVRGNGGSGLTDALRDLTIRHGVLIVIGNDWGSAIPYYSQRRALMIRTSTEHDRDHIEKTFAGLAGEEVAALVASGTQRQNHELIARTVAAFDLDPAVAFSHQDTDVYLPKSQRDRVLAKLRDAPVFDQVIRRGEPTAHPVIPDVDQRVRVVNQVTDRSLFGHMSPMPVRYHFSYDPNAGTIDGQAIVTAHPDSEIWFAPPSEVKEISCAFGILPGAYERTGSATDGVEFIISEKYADGTESVLYRRVLQPTTKPDDRGMQHIILPCHAAPGAELIFSTRPGESYAFDWAYWGKISLR